MAADGRPAYVESPVAVRTPGGVLLLGVPALIWAERDAFAPAPGLGGLDTAAYIARLRGNFNMVGFVLGPNHTATPVRPPFAGPMRKLAAVSGSDGTIHVAWFAPAKGSSDPEVDGTVWYAERRDDQWTAPTMVFSADRLDWSGQKPALLIRHNFDVHLVVPYYRGLNGGIAYIRRTDGRWTTIETELRGLPSQATAQFIGPDSLAVAFAGVGARGVRMRNGQHVFLIRAALSDTVWPTPTIVHFSDLDAVWSLGMHAVPSTHGAWQALALVWDRIPQFSPGSADTMYAMVSEDAGMTWHSPQMLPLPFKAASFAQERDTRGNVHIIVTAGDRSGANYGRVYHAALSKGRWTELDSSLPDSAASLPTLSSIGPDSLLLAWGIARSADRGLPGAIAPVTMYAIIVSACPDGTRP